MYKKPTPNLVKLAKEAFGYEGNTFQIFFDSDTYNLTNRWDGGSKNHAKLITIGKNGEDFDITNLPECLKPQVVTMPEGYFIVEHCIFQGKDLGIRVYLRPDGLPDKEKVKLIAEAAEESSKLSTVEKIVLLCFISLKSSYRKPEIIKIGISESEYSEALENLKSRGLVTKGNAVTMLGKNLKSSIGNLFDLETEYKKECIGGNDG